MNLLSSLPPGWTLVIEHDAKRKLFVLWFMDNFGAYNRFLVSEECPEKLIEEEIQKCIAGINALYGL